MDTYEPGTVLRESFLLCYTFVITCITKFVFRERLNNTTNHEFANSFSHYK